MAGDALPLAVIDTHGDYGGRGGCCVNHQMVGTTRDCPIAWSAVTSGMPCARAVAAIRRSAGSLGYLGGSSRVRRQASPVIGSTMNRASTSRKNASRLI